MKFFTDSEIIRSIYLSLLFGAFLSATYISADFLSEALKKILFLPYNATKLCKRFSIKYSVKLSEVKKRSRESRRNLFDAIIFSIFGILFILHFYITTDGIFRIYVVALVALSFCFSGKIIGNTVTPALEKCFSFIYAIILFFGGFIALPMYKTASLSVKIIQKLTEPLFRRYRLKKSKRIIAKKLREVEKLINTV